MSSAGAELVLARLDRQLGRPATLAEYLEYAGYDLENPEPIEDLPRRFEREAELNDGEKDAAQEGQVPKRNLGEYR